MHRDTERTEPSIQFVARFLLFTGISTARAPPPRQLPFVPRMKGMSAHRPSFQPNRKGKHFLKSYDGGSIVSGILSPALSAGGSTTVTPITPMTPLTTPRTPLQILLGRQNIGLAGGGPYSRRPSIPQRQNSTTLSDEEEDQYREKQLLALQVFANFLNTAETILNDIIEREDSGQKVLGPGIMRVCHDLADEIEGVARELHKDHLQAARSVDYHELALIEEIGTGIEEKKHSEFADAANETALALSSLTNSESVSSFQSHEEFIATLTTTHTLLLDMAAALRAITQQEAQELGEVALEVAHMFIWSLGVVHNNMFQRTVSSDFQQPQSNSSMDHANGMQEEDELAQNIAAAVSTKQHRVTWSSENTKVDHDGHGLGSVVEILGEEEKKDEHAPNYPDTPTKNSSSPPWNGPQLSPIPSSPGRLSPLSATSPASISSRHPGKRVRVLWPPLLPSLTEAGKHCANNAKEHPIPAIAIGLTCGPAAIATAAIAGPTLLVADWAIQTSYDALSEHTPVIENVEKGAANALQVARLGILCSKLVIKQGMAVGERQLERRGGVGKICFDVVDGAVDMARHPVETAGIAWAGVGGIFGVVKEVVGFVKDAVQKGELHMDIH